MKVVFDIEVTLTDIEQSRATDEVLQIAEKLVREELEKCVFTQGAVTKIVARAEEE